MVEALEDFGGAAHPSTIAQYAMRLWLHKDTEQVDDEYDFQDFRKAVKLELKRNPETFERAHLGGQFMEWQLTLTERQRRAASLEKWKDMGFDDRRHALNRTSMAVFLREHLADMASGMTYKQLESLIEGEWKRQGPFDSVDLMNMTLTTNPAFHDHDRDPHLWEVTAGVKPEAHKRFLGRSTASALGSAASPVPQPVSAADPTSFKRPERSRRRDRSSSREESPTRGPGRGKRKKEQASAASAAEGQWIRCDRCHKWVSTSLDDTITDLSLYDDLNPHHLDYHCPPCREEEEIESQRQNSRPTRVVAEITAVLDEYEKELIHGYRNSRSYWQKSMPHVAGGAELEEQWLQSVRHCKQRIINVEEDLVSARNQFREFFNEQLAHLKESLKNQR